MKSIFCPTVIRYGLPYRGKNGRKAGWRERACHQLQSPEFKPPVLMEMMQQCGSLSLIPGYERQREGLPDTNCLVRQINFISKHWVQVLTVAISKGRQIKEEFCYQSWTSICVCMCTNTQTYTPVHSPHIFMQKKITNGLKIQKKELTTRSKVPVVLCRQPVVLCRHNNTLWAQWSH